MALAEVKELYPSNFRDPGATLRVIADQIESGKFGAVGSIGIVLLGDTMEVFGAGPDSEPCSVALLFQAAIQRFAREIERHGT